jgi:hypothetical protein
MSREAYPFEIRLDMEQKHCLQIACKRWLEFPILPYFSQKGLKQKTGRKARQCLIYTGGAEGYRTLGLMTASHALSQLSYSPTFILYTMFIAGCQFIGNHRLSAQPIIL